MNDRKATPVAGFGRPSERSFLSERDILLINAAGQRHSDLPFLVFEAFISKMELEVSREG